MMSKFKPAVTALAGLGAAAALLAPSLSAAETLPLPDPQAQRWTAKLERRLDRELRYPAQPAVAREHGVAEVGFSVGSAGFQSMSKKLAKGAVITGAPRRSAPARRSKPMSAPAARPAPTAPRRWTGCSSMRGGS